MKQPIQQPTRLQSIGSVMFADVRSREETHISIRMPKGETNDIKTLKGIVSPKVHLRPIIWADVVNRFAVHSIYIPPPFCTAHAWISTQPNPYGKLLWVSPRTGSVPHPRRMPDPPSPSSWSVQNLLRLSVSVLSVSTPCFIRQLSVCFFCVKTVFTCLGTN